MAINLWKVAGKPVAYNPLPTGFANAVNLEIGEYIISFKASSISGAVLKFDSTNNTNFYVDGVQFGKSFTLSSTSTTYKISIKTVSKLTMYLVDNGNAGNIIIDSIELVQKPLSKLTINGVDGFKSGKWTLHANATVVDDETLVLNATAGYQFSNLLVNVNIGSTYVISCSDYVEVRENNATGAVIRATTGSPVTFVPNVSVVCIRVGNGGGQTGTFTFKRPMLNLGTTPAPYSKKTGDKMVMPVPVGNMFDGALEIGSINGNDGTFTTDPNRVRSKNFIPVKPSTDYVISSSVQDRIVFYFDWNKNFINHSGNLGFKTPNNCYFIKFRLATADLATTAQYEPGTTATPYKPYAVQVNAKPKRYVPKKNLVALSDWEQGSISAADGSSIISTSRIRSLYLKVKPNTTYTLSINSLLYDIGYNSYRAGRTQGVNSGWVKSPFTFTTGSDIQEMRLLIRKADDSIFNTDVVNSLLPQLEEGTTATPYEPYTPIIPRAKTGLSFDGVKDYFQLPSMTMDSIEIDCLIPSTQPNASRVLFDARNGLANGYVFEQNLTTGTGTLSVIGSRVNDVRTKYKIVNTTPFTDDVTIFANNSSGGYVKGTLYKVTCYLAGTIVAQYDFENPGNIVGDKISNGVAKNLIPSFEDARWSLHANTQVLGKDWLRLNATGTNQSNSIPVSGLLPNTTYILTMRNSGRCVVRRDSVSGGVVGSAVSYNGTSVLGTSLTFITPSDVTTVYITLDSYTWGAGTFDFIKPSLYQLDSKEGTIVGNPTKLRKPSKRKLYRKR